MKIKKQKNRKAVLGAISFINLKKKKKKGIEKLTRSEDSRIDPSQGDLDQEAMASSAHLPYSDYHTPYHHVIKFSVKEPIHNSQIENANKRKNNN